MESIYRNPYQLELTTEITNRKYEGDTTHLKTADTIFFDATSLHLRREQGVISGLQLVRTYLTNSGLIHVVAGKPSQSRLKMQLDPTARFENQREVTMRFLLHMALDTHYNRTPFGFRIENGASHCQINGAFTEEECHIMASNLQRILERYVRMGFDLETTRKDNTDVTQIAHLFSTPYLGPHLHSTSELYRFEITSVTPTKQGAQIFYRFL